MVHISLLALPDALASSLTLPLEMFTAADHLARTDRRRPSGIDSGALAHTVIGIDTDHVSTVGGLTLKPDADWRELGPTDLLILPALWRNPRIHLRRYPQLLPWLRERVQRGTRLCAVGTSSFFLAEAGLLDGQPATTHWFYLDDFARRYPRVLLKRHHLITEANGIFCTGSVNSVADLTVHFIEMYYGQRIARGVEAQFSPEIRRRFESNVFNPESPDVHDDELVIEAQDWLRTHHAEDLHIAALAQQLDTSLRSLNRRFRLATGMTPLAYLQQHRLETARDLLRTSNLSIAEIAVEVGYQDSGYFCRLFKHTMKQTPRGYRQAVRGKLFSIT
jgi:transcriptional regulator GlxA family with amidase domain